jgi:CBS domain-containing protein
VRDIDLWTVATCRAGEPVAEVRERLAEADLEIALLVDGDGRARGWLSERGLTGERVRPELRSPAEPVVELDDILRDALSDLLAHESMYAPVIDADGKVVGALSMQVISQAVGSAPSAIPSSAELAAGEAADEPVAGDLDPEPEAAGP